VPEGRALGDLQRIVLEGRCAIDVGSCVQSQVSCIGVWQLVVRQDQHTDRIAECAFARGNLILALDKRELHGVVGLIVKPAQARDGLLTGAVDLVGHDVSEPPNQLGIAAATDKLVPDDRREQLMAHGIRLRLSTFPERPTQLVLEQNGGLAEIVEQDGDPDDGEARLLALRARVPYAGGCCTHDDRHDALLRKCGT